MAAIAKDVVSSFNQFLAEQRGEPGECALTFVQFSDRPTVVFAGRNVNDVQELTAAGFDPKGGTALLDALGSTIQRTQRRLDATAQGKRPDHVMFVIITDGQENSSNEYTYDDVFRMISEQREQIGWVFLFLAANQDAIAEGARLGIGRDQSVNFDACGEGIRARCGRCSEN